jgi:hypothetical protein
MYGPFCTKGNISNLYYLLISLWSSALLFRLSYFALRAPPQYSSFLHLPRPTRVAPSFPHCLIHHQGLVSHPPSSPVTAQPDPSDSDASSNPSDSPRRSWRHHHHWSRHCRRDSPSSSSDMSGSGSEDSGSDFGGR